MLNVLRKFLRYSYRPGARRRKLSLRLHGVIEKDQYVGILESSIKGILRGGDSDVRE